MRNEATVRAKANKPTLRSASERKAARPAKTKSLPPSSRTQFDEAERRTRTVNDAPRRSKGGAISRVQTMAGAPLPSPTTENDETPSMTETTRDTSRRGRKANDAAITRACPSSAQSQFASLSSAETQMPLARDAGSPIEIENQASTAPGDQFASHTLDDNRLADARDRDGSPVVRENLHTFAPIADPNSDGLGTRANHMARAAGCVHGRGQDFGDTHGHRASTVDSIVEIQALWKMRQRWHKAEKSLVLQAKAFCRAMLGGDKDAANEVYDRAKKGENVEAHITIGLMPFLPAIERFEKERKQIEKNMKKLAKNLPAFSWVKSVNGFGEGNFVAIVGECGDIGSYKSYAAVWKRMGLAVIDGERQRKCADAEKALLHGYNPERRAVAYLLSECLLKKENAYRPVYAERKAYEIVRDPEIRPIIAHKRAMRYMVKRVLRNIRSAWRKEVGQE